MNSTKKTFSYQPFVFPPNCPFFFPLIDSFPGQLTLLFNFSFEIKISMSFKTWDLDFIQTFLWIFSLKIHFRKSIFERRFLMTFVEFLFSFFSRKNQRLWGCGRAHSVLNSPGMSWMGRTRRRPNWFQSQKLVSAAGPFYKRSELSFGVIH